MLSSSSSDNDGLNTEQTVPPMIPAPRLLNGTRLFLPYYGYVETGLSPKSDDFGNADVDTEIVISGKTGWLCLNSVEIVEFFLFIRDVDTFSSIDGRTYFPDDHYVNFGGVFKIVMSTDSITIEYVDAEGEKNSVVMDLNDLKHLLSVENLFPGFIQRTDIAKRDTVNAIENLAMECNGNSDEVKRRCMYWWCSNIVFEMAHNHFHFFSEYVDEYQRSIQDDE